jgi:hypothetical protein
MIKLTSMTALQIFFFMARIIPLVASIGERREALLDNVAERPASFSVPVVRILGGFVSVIRQRQPSPVSLAFEGR